MSLDYWLAYVLTVLVLMSTPGPSHLLMLSNSLRHGFGREAHEMTRRRNADTKCDKGQSHTCCQSDGAETVGLNRSGQHDGQHRKDTGVNQGQQTCNICEEIFHDGDVALP